MTSYSLPYAMACTRTEHTFWNRTFFHLSILHSTIRLWHHTSTEQDPTLHVPSRPRNPLPFARTTNGRPAWYLSGRRPSYPNGRNASSHNGSATPGLTLPGLSSRSRHMFSRRKRNTNGALALIYVSQDTIFIDGSSRHVHTSYLRRTGRTTDTCASSLMQSPCCSNCRPSSSGSPNSWASNVGNLSTHMSRRSGSG